MVSPTVLSIYAGGGGLDLGLRLAMPDARTVGYVEREAAACEILATNIEAGRLDDAPIWTDAATFDCAPWRGKVDWVVGGPPCQPFSNAGLHLGADDSRNQWPTALGMVAGVQPGGCFFENVAAADSLWYIYEEVIPGLQSLGYKVACGIFTAAEIGAPHVRDRIFIFATYTDRSRIQRPLTGVDTGEIGQGWPRGEENLLAIANAPFQPGDSWPQPLLRRVDDGMADWVDRIHILGNGVVPQQAALAFRTLVAELI